MLLDNPGFHYVSYVIDFSGKYHDTDLNRIRNDDRWLSDFLVQNDMNMKDSLKHLLETCEWRQKFGTNGK